MKVSLLRSILPPCGSVERNDLDQKLKIQVNVKRCERQKQCTQNNKVISLLLKMTDESISAICNVQARQFDALVKNFGCQITALQVCQALQSSELIEEATSLMDYVKNCLSKPLSVALPDKTITFDEFLSERLVDREVSPILSQLVRFRMLCVVNCNRKTESGREEPYTNLDLLVKKVAKIDANLVERIVSGIQADESVKAAKFIKQQAKLVEANSELLQRVVSKRFRRRSKTCKTAKGREFSPITSVSLLFNTEIVIRRIAGPILIKNKLSIAGVKIEGAEKLNLYMKMPEEKILSCEEVDLLQPAQPLIVIEGYIRNAQDLSAAIARLGLLAIVNANTTASHVMQYASQTDQSPIEDDDAREYLNKYSQEQELVENLFEIDHIYCSSIGEENEIAT